MKALPVGQGSVSFRVNAPAACRGRQICDGVTSERACQRDVVQVGIHMPLLHGGQRRIYSAAPAAWRGMVRHVWHSA